MRFIAVALLTLLTAQAEARPRTQDMTCGAVQDLVRSQGPTLLQTGPRNYDLYYAGRFSCMRGMEEAVRQFAPTLDMPRCHIGYICRPRIRYFDD